MRAASTARTGCPGAHTGGAGAGHRIAAYCTVVALSIVVLFPFLWMFHLSFKQNQDIFAFPPKLFFEPTLNHYTTLFDKVFTRSFVNSLVTSVASTLVAMLVGTPAAFALSRANYRAGPSDQPVGAGHPHGAAHRVHAALLPDLPGAGPAGHADSA